MLIVVSTKVLATNSLIFPSSDNVFTLDLLLMYIFIVYRILGLQFFSFNILKILFHCLLASMVSHEKSVVSQIVVLISMKYN